MMLVLLLGLSALRAASADSQCLDLNNTEYRCEIDTNGTLDLSTCDIADEDVDSGDLASCLDAAGRGRITVLELYNNSLSTLPEGIFQDLTALTYLTLGVNYLDTVPESIFQNLTALETLDLGYNDLTTLHEGMFQDLTALTVLNLHDNSLPTLPEGVFQDLTALTHLSLGANYFAAVPEGIFRNSTTLETLKLHDNSLTTLPEDALQDLTALTYLSLKNNDLNTLPEGVFQDLTALTYLALNDNTLTTLPEGIFQNLTALTYLELYDNSLTTLPESVFQNLTALIYLDITGNDLECLPTTTLSEVDGDATTSADGLHVDWYGDECGCYIVNVTENVCGEETCTPGPVGYTCANSTIPTAAPASDITSTNQSNSASHSTAIIAGAVCAVAFVPLVALAVWRRRRRASDQKNIHASAPPSTCAHNNLEQGREQTLDVRPPRSAARTVGDGSEKSPSHQHNASPYRQTPMDAQGGDGRGIVLSSAPTSLDGLAQSTAQHAKSSAEDYGVGRAVEGTTDRLVEASMATTAPTAPGPTPKVSSTERAEQAELAQFHQRQCAANAGSVAGPSRPVDASGGESVPSPAIDRSSSARHIGLTHAVLEIAKELAGHCQVPGVREAAAAVCIMANLVSDGHENDRARESRLRQCRTIVMALKRAARVAEKGGDTIGEAARVWIEDVHDAIFDLVELIKTFQNKNKLSKLFMSTLFKRRQDELDAVVDRAINRLQLGLQLQVGQDVSTVKDNVSAGFKAVMEEMNQGSAAHAKSESVAEARSIRRQHKLNQVEIPEDDVSITTDLLGKGGFGEVYLADYNGHNAAAKVLSIAHDFGVPEENRIQRETSQRKAFLRELEAMIRLRSPNTVNVYGAVTSLSDRMVLVMELLAGGDLLALLRQSAEPLPVGQSRRIIRDICTGMAFLHSKNTVHGDLKSANVLLDGDGRAKIADFGTSRWSQHTNYTGLATYTTQRNCQSIQMSVAWSAPEVLDSEPSTYKSDVYSFGIVVWEVLSRELPWANKTRLTEILTSVVKGTRPSFREDAPADIVDIAKACWGGDPNERTTFGAVLEGIKAQGWSDGKV